NAYASWWLESAQYLRNIQYDPDSPGFWGYVVVEGQRSFTYAGSYQRALLFSRSVGYSPTTPKSGNGGASDEWR
ncbi:MAG: hypothetical protein VX834_05050, partial [Myxococcota bacterium]|nr:hypothetical protein [Myxococcota bacterium]